MVILNYIYLLKHKEEALVQQQEEEKKKNGEGTSGVSGVGGSEKGTSD